MHSRETITAAIITADILDQRVSMKEAPLLPAPDVQQESRESPAAKRLVRHKGH